MPIRPENRDRYPADWKTISLRIRTVRAASRCECSGECGRGTHTGRCPNVNGGQAYGTGSKVVLTVAHLDHTPENVDETNLRAMCQGCHLHYDRDHHPATHPTHAPPTKGPTSDHHTPPHPEATHAGMAPPRQRRDRQPTQPLRQPLHDQGRRRSRVREPAPRLH